MPKERFDYMKKLSKLLLILVSLTALIFIAACGNSSSDSQQASSSANSSSDDVVNIGTMNLVNGDLIAQYEKYYEQELGVKVNIIQFKSGKDVNAALAAGSVDITELGSAPVALGISNNVDYKVFWVGDVIGSAETLVAKNDSGINSVADLKGKKVATPFASTAHYSLLNAIKKAGLTEADVKIVDLQPNDIYAAWQRGDIDAAYIWYPVLSELLKDGKTITNSEELANQGIITADLNVVRSDYAAKHPDVVTKYVKAQIKANDILLNDKDKAVKEIASLLAISEDDARSQIGQFKYLTTDEQLNYLNDKLPQTLADTAKFLVEQNSIKEAASLDTFKQKITTEFVEAATKQ